MQIRQEIERGFEGLGHWIVRRRYFVIPLFLFFAVLLSSQAPRINVETSVESMLKQDDPAKILYNEFRDQFGRDEVIIVAVRSPDVLAPNFLEQLRAFHEALEEETPHLEEVRSLINARVTRAEEDELVVEDLLEKWPDTPSAWRTLREFVMQNPFYRNLLISDDAKLTTVMIETSAYSALDHDIESALGGFEEQAGEVPPTFLSGAENAAVHAAVLNLAERFEGPGFKIDITGSPLLQAEIAQSMTQNMARFVGLMFVIIGFLLFVLFRRISGVLLPLLMVAPTVSGTIGAMAISGRTLSAPSQILPSMLLAVGVGTAVHILTIFYQRLDAGATREDAIAGALGHSGLAVCMSGLTTAGGLLSFVAAEVAPVRDIGIFAPFGICLALLYCLILLPAVVAILPIKSKTARPAGEKSDAIERSLIAAGEFSIRNARPILLGVAIVCALSLVSATRLTFGHDVVRWLGEGHPYRTATDLFDSHLAGSMSLELIADSGRENGVQNPALLRGLDEFAREIEANNEQSAIRVGKASSLADVVKEIHQALHSNQKAFYEIPDDRKLIAQELLLFENTGSDETERLVDSQFSMARLSVRVSYSDPIHYKPFIDSAVARLQEILGPDVEIRATGFVGVMSRTISALLASMVRSYLLALVIITPLMIFLIGSLRSGLASMVPNLTPILITLGLMGFFEIEVSAFTLMIGGIAIGLAVDDTIHYMHNFRRYFTQYGNVGRASAETLRTTGRALLTTSVVLSTGFIVFIFSDMNNLVDFGLLTSFTIASAFLIDILVSPALMSIAYRTDKK